MDQTFNQATPTDKVQVGWITTQILMKIVDAVAKNDATSYMNLVSVMDKILICYKDTQYDREMEQTGLMVKLMDMKTKKPVTKQGGSFVYVRNPTNSSINKQSEADSVLVILMKLMQRSNFMPIKVYEGDLYVDTEKEKDLTEDVPVREDS